MKVVRGLGAGTDGQLPSGSFVATAACCSMGRCVLPGRKKCLKDSSASAKDFSNIAEFQGDALMNVAFFAVLVNARFGSGEDFFGIGDGGENFVLDVDEVQSFERGDLLAAMTAAIGSPTCLT